VRTEVESIVDRLRRDGSLPKLGVLGWVGGRFDPEESGLDEMNASLERYDRHARQRRMGTR
jgi:hypothetical protein